MALSIVTLWLASCAKEPALLRQMGKLAVANSNLKAAHMAAREGSAALDRFLASIDAATRSSSDVTFLRSLTTAATSAARMRSLGATIDSALREAGVWASATSSSDAAQAWAEYQRIEAR